MPQPSSVGPQTIHFRSSRTQQEIYTGTANRDISVYPLNMGGQSAFEAAVLAGSFDITVDNGFVIPAGTVPPLTKPSASVAAFSQLVTAANGTGTGTAQGLGFFGIYNASGNYLQGTFNATKTAVNYTVFVHYKTNTQNTGHANIIVNGGAPIEFVTEGAEGGVRTAQRTISLNLGVNTIRVEWKDGTGFYIDTITVTRPAD